jgi:UDP-N-acetylglucosamine 2-epimerase (non-hydrolysing)
VKKVISVVGARPNFMKVAPLDRAFKKYSDKIRHLIVHTGQHYDYSMSDAFFRDLDMPQPAYFLGVGSGSHAEQTAKIILEFEKVCLKEKPDLVIVVGDVNSTIGCVLTAVKLGIKTAHIEAGLRSFDRTMPEEINRKATDAICDWCFVTEQSAVDNLLREGFDKENIFFVGNTMIDSQYYAKSKAINAKTHEKYHLNPKEYVLVTIHRPSNVDESEQLNMLLRVLENLSTSRNVIFPVHPRTKKNIESYGIGKALVNSSKLTLCEPLGYIDFLSLMLNSDFVITDSGGIQEETTVLGIPCITIRTTTERPSTVELGTNVLVYPDFEHISSAISNILDKPRKNGIVPPLWDGNTSERITEIIAEKLLLAD